MSSPTIERICLASGQGDAATHLQDALEGFARAQLPMELARTRLELARALSEPMPEVAVAEAAAYAIWQKISP